VDIVLRGVVTARDRGCDDRCTLTHGDTMKKIRLNPDHLRVESFATAIESRNRGTVAAHSGSTDPGNVFTVQLDCTNNEVCHSVASCVDNAPDSFYC
jgi:hypothetical protein